MLCASSQNPAELRKYSNFQLPNCNCKFLQYTLRRNFPLATILLLPCYRFTSIPPVNRIQNFQLSYHLIWLYLTYTQHIPNIYLTYTLHIPCIYLPYTLALFCIYQRDILCQNCSLWVSYSEFSIFSYFSFLQKCQPDAEWKKQPKLCVAQNLGFYENLFMMVI